MAAASRRPVLLAAGVGAALGLGALSAVRSEAKAAQSNEPAAALSSSGSEGGDKLKLVQAVFRLVGRMPRQRCLPACCAAATAPVHTSDVGMFCCNASLQPSINYY